MAYSDYGGGGYSRGGADYGHGYGGGYEYDDGYERGNDEYSRGNEYGRGNEYSRGGGGGGGGGGGRGYGGRGRGGGRGQSMGRGRGRGGRGGMRSAEGDGGDDKKKAGLIICIDYFYGTCSRGDTCMRPHVDYVESIGDRELLAKVKFCHDFQNRGECAKVGCKFLHVTRSEEDEFLLTGSIPPSVIERCSQDSVGDDSAYSGGYSSGNGGGRGRGGPGGRGGGRGLPRGRGGIGQKRSYDGDQGGFSKVPRGAGGARGGRGGRGDRGRGRGRGRGGEGVGHSTSLPVTYSGICVDYLKDSCTKGIACQLIHCDVVEDQDDRYGLVTSVFCHDFQNGACLRQFCKFVHASLSEENFFIENGYFPPTLNSRNKDKLLYSDICLDYLCNACTRPRCNYRHVEKVESINERLCLGRSIFCHDFQEGNCTRSPCKMVHMSKKGEEYFNETGCFPRDLFAAERGDNKSGGSGGGGGGTGRGRGRGRGGGNFGGVAVGGHSSSEAGGAAEERQAGGLPAENDVLKSRVNQLERLLADACYCMTLAVGDQNPAISTLMKTISDLAPESALANQASTSETTTSTNE